MIFLGALALEILVLYLLTKRIHLGFGRLIRKITGWEGVAGYLLAVLFLPGTFVHEAAHFLTALFLLVPVGQMELMPEVEGRQIKLGSVPVGKTDFIRRTLIGFAPVVFGIAAISAIVYFALQRGFLGMPFIMLFVLYLVFAISNTMFLSKSDIEGSWKILVLLLFISVLFYVVGLRIEISFVNSIFTQKFVDFIKQVAIFLLMPVAVDSAFIILFKALKLI